MSEPSREASALRVASDASLPLRDAGWQALIWFLIGIIPGLLVVRTVDLDPFTVAGAVFPVTVGVIGAIVLGGTAIGIGNRIDMTGPVVGLFSAWLGLVLSAALHGTPFGYGGLIGDMGRLTAAVTRFSTTWQSVDAFLEGTASEYPPLYPWVVARVSNLVGHEAWALVKYAEILTIPLAVVFGFALWARLVSPTTAAFISVLTLLVFPDPRKAFQILALIVFVPWVLGAFAERQGRAGSFHWLWAGVIAGLIVQIYHGYFVYSAVGIVAIIGHVVWRREDRRRYLHHVAGVMGVAFVVAAWYVVPFAWQLLTRGSESLSDLYLTGTIAGRPLALPFLEMSPLGLLQFIGLLGAIWYIGKRWWAAPLLMLVAGTYAYVALSLLRLVLTGHTGFLHYASRPISAFLVAAGVLTLAEVLPHVLRTEVGPRRVLLGAALALAMVWTGTQGWDQWMPSPRGLKDAVSPPGGVNAATYAHAEPLPDGEYPLFAPSEPRIGWFPTEQVVESVESVLGEDARPVTLSYSERLFAFEPWYAYAVVDRTAAPALMLWDDRQEALNELSRTGTSEAFARASALTEFGPIDVFVLRKKDDGWWWNDVRFEPTHFDSPYFTVFEDLPRGAVVAVRHEADVD